jgi:hypothetical protein
MKKSSETNFLIDGFPRNKDNVDGWQKTMGDSVNIQCVLVFDCDEKVKNILFFLFYDQMFFLLVKRLVLLDVLNVVNEVDELMIMKKV